MPGANNPGWGTLLRLVAFAVMVAVRLIAWNADPPSWLSWSTGIGTDEGFYTLDARHEVLFGHGAPGNFHDRLLSPLLSGLQQAVFALFGPSLLTARLLCVVFGLLTIGVFWLGLRRSFSIEAADAGALFLGLAPPFVFYNRLALQETPTVFWLVLAFVLWAFTQERRGSLFSGMAFALAVIFKPLALLTVPAFVWLWRKPSWVAPALGVCVVLFLYAVFWYEPHHVELSRMGTFYRVHQFQPRSWKSVWLNVRRGVIGGERGVIPYLLVMLPVPVLLAIGAIRCSTPAPPELGAGGHFFALWLGGGLAFCLLSSYAPSRYYVLFLPALAGLAALGWMRLPTYTKAVAIAAFLLVSGFWFGQAWTHRMSARQDAAQTLTRLLPSGSIVIGEFAPALCLNTPFISAPVQPGLSNDDQPVERLHATAIVVTRTAFWEHWWRSRYPAIFTLAHRVATFTLDAKRHWVVDVYRVQ